MSLNNPGIRDLVDAVAPPWLGGGVPANTPLGDDGTYAQRELYALCGLSADLLPDKAEQATYARMPSRAPPSALPYIGRDRQIVRGLGDTDASYAVRLQGAIPAWRYAGTDRGVMSQVLSFVGLSPDVTPMARIVQTNYTLGYTTWRTYVPDTDLTQPPATYTETPIDFDWDSVFSFYPRGSWRFWLVLFAVAPQDFCHAAPTLGSGGPKLGDPSISVGFDVPSSVWQTVRAIVKQWKRSGSSCEWVVVSFSNSLFDPAQPDDGTHNPAGTFGKWGHTVGTEYVEARFGNARYCAGVQ